MNGHRRSWHTVAVLVVMTCLQVSLAAFSLYVLSAVRAYVAGESLYSKGQKDAQIYLLDYAENHREVDYLRLIGALSVPIADRRAREELQKPAPDLEVARQAFIAGGNHPEDVTALVRLFLWFGRTPLMSDAIETWTRGDQVIEQMQKLVERTRERVLAGQTDAEAMRQIRLEAPELNKRLTELESQFSAQLGEASRRTQTALLVANGLLAVVLTLSGVTFVRRTARVQARTEAEVVRRQESLQNLLDSAAEGLFGVDLAGRCTFVNRAALQILGYEREEELLGQPILERIRVHPAEQRSDPLPGDATHTRTHSDSELYRRRDGSVIPVEHWSHTMVRDGGVYGMVTTFFDISEKIRLRDELRRGQIVMERLVGAVTDGVITFDDSGRVLVFNGAAEKMFLTPSHAALGGPVERFFDPPFALHELAAHAQNELLALTGKRAATDSTFHLEASFSRIETEGRMLNTLVLRDVTARELARMEREQREALEASNRARTEFLSRMSHELRTPLNAVIGFAQLLRADASRASREQQLVQIEHIERAGAHLLALVNDVLDLARIDAGEMAVTVEPVDLAAVAEEAATLVSPLVTQAGVELYVSPAEAGDEASHRGKSLTPLAARHVPSTVWVRADSLRLRQVLVNVLSNAVKYNRPGGSVSLSWRIQGEECQVDIADTGIGIAPEKLEQLFEPFNRLGAEASKVEGTGIGLVLSRRLSELMGGRLRIASTPGEGTVATVVLALVKSGKPPTLSIASANPPATVGRLDVLYAEDNEVNAEIVRHIVSNRPAIRLEIATDGRSALAMARARCPDLILVDMNLGDMTGLELAAELHRDDRTRGIELIALSA
ncbi:MAG TPA: ATP-binding protein, partial [Burkholderiaceae bacterium]|nr:ATP-binding protein [Burkholderiaceae bacterium]